MRYAYGRRRVLQGLAAAGVSALLPLRVAAGVQPVTRQLRFALSIHNPGPALSVPQRMWFYGPLSLGNGWALASTQCSADVQSEVDAEGQTRLYFAQPGLPAGATRVMTGRFALQAVPGLVGLGVPARWLRAEPGIEVDAPAIVAAGRGLKADTAVGTANAIYAFVQGRITYAGYVAEDLGALYALEHGRGDCSEYAFLAAALARVNGIPARVLGGFVCDGDCILKDGDYHNWAELWLDGRWQVLDAQKGCVVGDWVRASTYLGFHVYGAGERSCNSECWRYVSSSLVLHF